MYALYSILKLESKLMQCIAAIVITLRMEVKYFAVFAVTMRQRTEIELILALEISGSVVIPVARSSLMSLIVTLEVAGRYSMVFFVKVS